ncbi:hypothetical protein ACX818_001407 [Acinetobacter baumannii]
MAKSTKQAAKTIELPTMNKRGQNRDPQATQKLSLKLAFARCKRLNG